LEFRLRDRRIEALRPLCLVVEPHPAEVGTAEVGIAEVGIGQVGTAEVGIGEVGTDEVGTGEVGIGEVGIADPGMTEVGLTEVGTIEAGTAQDGTAEVGTEEVGLPQVGALKVGAAEVRTVEVGAPQEGAGEGGSPQLNAAEIGSAEVGMAEVGTAELGAAERTDLRGLFQQQTPLQLLDVFFFHLVLLFLTEMMFPVSLLMRYFPRSFYASVLITGRCGDRPLAAKCDSFTAQRYRARNGMKTLQGLMGVIEAVDTKHYTCTVRTEFSLLYDVPITPLFLSPNGQGVWFLPEVGTRVLVGTLGKGSRNEYSFLIGACFHVDPSSTDDDTAQEDGSAVEDVSEVDFRNNRPVLQPGEIVLSSSDRNFVIMRKGGIIEIGATQAAKRFYVPLQNLVRDLCQVYELQSSAGSLHMTRKEADNTWGTVDLEIPAAAPDGEADTETVTVPKVPTEMNFRVKAFESDNDPVVSIDFGNITRTFLAEEGRSDDDPGNIIHDQLTTKNENGLAEILARININNVVRLFVDRSGNVFSTTKGAEIHIHEGARHEEIHHGATHKEYKQQFRAFYATKVEETSNTVLSHAGKGHTTTVGNTDNPETTWALKPEGAALDTTGAVAISGSKFSVRSEGLIELIAGTDVAISCDTLVLTTLGDVKHISAKSKEETIINADQSGVAYRLINESSGELQIHNSLGAVRISTSGRPGLGGLLGVGLSGVGVLGEIEIKPSGAISVAFLAGGVKTNRVVVNATGCSLKTPGGEISIDTTGQVNLGGVPSGIGNGRVVTTLTHPVCYVTGLPINGSTKVGAASLAGLPSAGVTTAFIE